MNVFYQCWDRELPAAVLTYTLDHLPLGSRYQRVSLAEARAYLADVWGADMASLFDSYALIPHKVDLWRYCLLYDRGGLYMDADCVLLGPIDDLVEDSDCFFVSNDRGDNNIFNGFLGTLPGNPTYKQIIDFMVGDAGRSQRDYYFNCNQLYECLSTRIRLVPGVESYRDGSTRIGVLWDTRGDDGRYYASYRGVVRLAETNELYPYARQATRFGRS